MWNGIKNNLSLVFCNSRDFIYSFYNSGEIIEIKPFRKELYLKAIKLKSEIERLCPRLDVNLIGSVGLNIEGRGDIDLYAGCSKHNLKKCWQRIEESFGSPAKIRSDYYDWDFIYKGVPVELRVADENCKRYKKQLRLFNLLKSNPHFLRDYRKIKKSLAGHSMGEYVRARIVFFNRILRSSQTRLN